MKLSPEDQAKRAEEIRRREIQFLSDCSHALAGQTVPMQPFRRSSGGSTIGDSDGDDGA